GSFATWPRLQPTSRLNSYATTLPTKTRISSRSQRPSPAQPSRSTRSRRARASSSRSAGRRRTLRVTCGSIERRKRSRIAGNRCVFRGSPPPGGSPPSRRDAQRTIHRPALQTNGRRLRVESRSPSGSSCATAAEVSTSLRTGSWSETDSQRFSQHRRSSGQPPPQRKQHAQHADADDSAEQKPGCDHSDGQRHEADPDDGQRDAAVEEGEMRGVGLPPFVAPLFVDGAEASPDRQTLAETADGGGHKEKDRRPGRQRRREQAQTDDQDDAPDRKPEAPG